MKLWKSFVAGVFAFSLLTGVGFAGEPMPGVKTKPNAGFEMLKPLVGDWQGKSIDGKPVTISYALVSDGSALMEKISTGHDSEMVTIYHPDGDSLMMTHYCAVHNQPRMRAGTVTPDSKRIAFDFVDATNLAAPDAGHMHRLVVTFKDRDRFVQEWTWKEKDKEKVEVFTLERKK
jgi:hypothetical protein